MGKSVLVSIKSREDPADRQGGADPEVTATAGDPSGGWRCLVMGCPERSLESKLRVIDSTEGRVCQAAVSIP